VTTNRQTNKALAVQNPPLPIKLPGVISATGWQLPKGLSFEQWAAAGQALMGIEGAVQWLIGDWWAYGEHKYAQRKAATESGGLLEDLNFETAMNYGVVARAIETSRRREVLSFKHHTEVAALTPSQQDRWLALAERENLSAAMLRRAIKKDKRRAVIARLLTKSKPVGESYALKNTDCASAVEIGERVDWIVTDPPYPKEFLNVYDDLGAVAAQVMKPGGSLLCMVGQSYLPEIVATLSRHLTYHWMLAYLTPGGQAVQIFPRKINTFWKPVLWFVKGEYGGDWIGDVTRSAPNDNDKRFHDWGQSESGMLDLMTRFVKPRDVVLDPFMGAGTTGLVTLRLDASFIGYDVDQAAYNEAMVRISGASKEAVE
jgi:DNA methylase